MTYKEIHHFHRAEFCTVFSYLLASERFSEVADGRLMDELSWPLSSDQIVSHSVMDTVNRTESYVGQLARGKLNC